jgi:uncharacterized membrane protein YkgB
MKRTEYIAFIFAHLTFFIIFVWFGALKILGLSPATHLVLELFNKTLAPYFSFPYFIMLFGCFEVLIGILFIIPRMEKLAFTLLLVHMITIVAPLFMLPEITWASFMVPTLEGQYIIKNLLIIALAASIFADMSKKRA